MQKLRMTNAGQALVTKLIAGTSEINFTKMKTSDHVYQASDIAGLTELDDVKQTVSVSSATIVSGTVVRVRATVNNTGATTGYWIKAVGLYAMDEAEEEEILFGVSLSDNAADYIPPQTVTTTGITYTVNCRVGNTEYVDVTVDPAAVVAMEDFEEMTEYVIDVENALLEHKNGSMMLEEGQHGVRYYGNMLQYYDNGVWLPIETCGYRLKVWTGGIDAVVTATQYTDNEVLVLRQKTVDSVARFILPSCGTWNITAEKEGVLFSTATSSPSADYNYSRFHARLNAIPTSGKIYGFKIDLNESDPDLAVTYTDDAVGITPGSGWDNEPIFSRIRPLLWKSGHHLVGYLNPNNYAQFVDGTPADITSGNLGEVFVHFPVMYVKAETDTANNTLTVQIADHEVSGFNKLNSKLIAAYLASGNSYKSLSGGTVNKGAFSTSSTNGYNINFETIMLLRHLFILRYKSLNSRAYLGKGYVGELTTSDGKYYMATTATTGGTDDKGMYYGTNSTSEQIKFCGLEDIYGNAPVKVDYLQAVKRNSTLAKLFYRYDNNYYFGEFGDISTDSSGYEYALNTPKGSYYLKNIAGSDSSMTGYVPTGDAVAQTGSAETYFCNPVNIDALPARTSSTGKTFSSHYYMYFGMQLCRNPEDPSGNKIVDDTVGMFSMDLKYSSAELSYGTRKMFTLS